MKVKKYILLLLVVLCSTSVLAQKKSKEVSDTLKRPKLVLAIVVDQMRYDYLFKYWDNFSDGGFKKLVSEGYLFQNAKYSYVPTYTAPGHACIFTGATPSLNGIVSNNWYDRISGRDVYCVSDSTVMPVGTAASAGKMSPRNLLTTTIADELRMQLNFKAKTIGVSLKDRGAVLPVGHTATVAYWFDASSSSWVTSTYYLHELPQWLKKYNDLKRPDYFLSSPWNLLLPPDRYTSSTADDNSYEGLFAGESKPVFPHNLPQIRATDTEVIRKTPFGNTITMEVAVEAIKGEKLGADSLTDFLSVSFSSTDYVGHMYGTMAMEVEDTYIRLDRDLATLLDYVDSAIGKKNVLVFLTSDHGAAHNPVYLKDHKIPSGHLQFNFINDTLQKALAAKYGQENFIADAASDGIYLNHRLIKQKGFALPEVQQFCAGFLSGLQVFAAVFTSEDLKGGNTLIGIGLFVQRGFYEARSPDISLVIHPGWIGYSTTTGTTHGSPYDYDTHVPLIFYGWNIKHGSSAAATDICDIAPTVSGILKISHPSGSMGTPIKLLLGK